MQGIRIDLAGQRFNRLRVVSYAETRAGRAYWDCRCDCGAMCIVSGKYLRGGRTGSCGCLHRELTGEMMRSHGMSASKTYATWGAMLSRCYNPKQKCYEKYGAKGVTVCERWRASFANFLEDMGERPPGKTLDRRNPFGNYDPGNCRWADAETQSANKRGAVAIAVLEKLKMDGYGDLIAAAFSARYP